MPLLQIVSSKPNAGRTAVAVALARGFADGSRVRLVRTGDSAAAVEDARTFTEYLFASTPGVPQSAAAIAAADGEIVVVEGDAGSATLPDASMLLVVRREMTEADLAVANNGRLLGTIATDIPPARVEAVARDLTNAGLRPLALVPEDRRIAAPSVGEIREALGAKVLYEGENETQVVEDVLLSPVYADPARPHFLRFASKAVLAPFNKTDLHLAAIETRAACLVITGGGEPSPYVVDRAQGESTTVLLAPHETPETVAQLGDVFLTSRFRGERKAEVMHDLLSARLDIPGLLRKL